VIENCIYPIYKETRRYQTVSPPPHYLPDPFLHDETNFVGRHFFFTHDMRHFIFSMLLFPTRICVISPTTGADYKQKIPPKSQHTITIEHSRPFRMRKPAHQAEFFKLLAKVLCYIVSGDNDVGYVSKSEWNPYWRIRTGSDVILPFPLLPYASLRFVIFSRDHFLFLHSRSANDRTVPYMSVFVSNPVQNPIQS